VNTDLETEFWNVLTAGFTKHWIETNIQILLRHSFQDQLLASWIMRHVLQMLLLIKSN